MIPNKTVLKKFLSIFILLNLTYLNSQTTNTEFADKVVGSYYSYANIFFTDFYGGIGYNFPIPMDPHMIEGGNTAYFVSLPTGSYLILEFTNNKIIDYPNQDDIFVTENGCNNEKAEIYISSDGIKFTRLGIVNDCDISSLDLASIGYKDPVKFVKVVGLDYGGNSPGFDLINVKGLPNSSIEVIEDAITDSLNNLLEDGFITTNIVTAAGYEWIIESELLKESELNIYDSQSNKITIHYLLTEVNKIIIDASGLKKGVYTIELKLKNKIIQQAIIIK